MTIGKIRLIGWISVSIFLLTILGLSVWNAINQWNVETDNLSYEDLASQQITTGLSIGAMAVIGIITILALLFGLYGQIEDVYGTDTQ